MDCATVLVVVVVVVVFAAGAASGFVSSTFGIFSAILLSSTGSAASPFVLSATEVLMMDLSLLQCQVVLVLFV